MPKFALFVAGLAVGAFFVAEFYGFNTISDETLRSTSEMIMSNFKLFIIFLKERLGHLMSEGGSAIVGFAVGLKIG